MRVVTPLVMLAAVFAALFHGATRPASACQCTGFTGDEQLAEYLIDHSTALAVVRVASSERQERITRREDVTRGELILERLVSGSSERTIKFESNNLAGCGAYDIGASRFHFLVLDSGKDGAFWLNVCSGFPMVTRSAALRADEQEFLNALLQARSGDGTHPLLLAAYFAASAAGLVTLVAWVRGAELGFDVRATVIRIVVDGI